MARVVGKLNALSVSRAKMQGYYGDGGGLYLLVGPNAAKSWVFRYRVPAPDKPNGTKLREMGLGPLHTIGLAEAREKARECRHARLDGIDPIETRKATRTQAKLEAAKAMTFRECAERYIASHKAGWRNPKHAKQWPATLNAYAYPVFGALPVQAIDVGLVMTAIEPIWAEKPETAARLRGRVESVLDWATTRGYRSGENPARWRGHLENLLPRKSRVKRANHFAALPYSEVGAFLSELRQRDDIADRALEFLILTATRTGEVIRATWSEIDLDARQWTIPGSRTKTGREHRVPLSEPAAAILKAMKEIRQSDYVFPGSRAGRPPDIGAMLAVLRAMDREATAHGFRSSFRDWAAEQTAFPREIAELSLGHTVASAVERAYQRSDLLARRRQLMEAWARYCTAPAVAGEVVTLAVAR